MRPSSSRVTSGLPTSCSRAAAKSTERSSGESPRHESIATRASQTILVCTRTSPSRCQAGSCWQSAIGPIQANSFWIAGQSSSQPGGSGQKGNAQGLRGCAGAGFAMLHLEEVHAVAEQVGDDGPVEPVPLGGEDGRQEVRPHVLVPPDDLPVLLDLDVEALHEPAAVRLPPGPLQVEPQPLALLAEPLPVLGGDVLRRPDERRQVLEPLERALVEHRHGDDGQAGEQLRPAGRAEEGVVAGVEDVELQEVVRQGVVEDGVLGVEPLAVDDVAVAEPLVQGRGSACWPTASAG